MLTLLFEKLVNKYPSPGVLNLWWNFGFLCLIFMFSQLITGLLSCVYYENNVIVAFSSLLFFKREVLFGDIIHMVHALGASALFAFVYLHLMKNMYYGSYLYPRHMVWYTGLLLFILLQSVCFLGYILPWGQMGYWATVVVSTMLTIIPLFGYNMVILFWGDVIMNDTCLMRAFCLHYLLPFIMLAFLAWHILVLHEYGSSVPFCVYIDKITLSAYFIIKDSDFAWAIVIIFFLYCLIIPEMFIIPINYIMASKRVTPAHIVPEWYMQPFYSVLRSTSDKVWGVFLIVSIYITLITLNFTRLGLLLKRSSKTSLVIQCIFFFIVPCWVLLTFYGSKPFEFPFDFAGALLVSFFFFYFWFFNLSLHFLNFIVFWGCYYWVLIKIVFEVQYKQKKK